MLGSVKFTLSALSVSVILTDPPISIFSNNIWAISSIPIIWFLVILFPIGVVIHDAYGRFSRKARKSFSVTTLIVVLKFCSFFFSHLVKCFAHILLNCFANLVKLFCSQLYSCFLHFCQKESNDNSLSHFVSSLGLYYNSWR